MANFLMTCQGYSTGRNLEYIRTLVGRDPILCTHDYLRLSIDLRKIPPSGEEWVIPELAKILGLKIEDKYCKIWGQETLREEEKEDLEEAIMSLSILKFSSLVSPSVR